MTDIQEEVKNKLRRSIGHEFSRMEDDFDKTRDARQEIIDKMMVAVRGVKLVDDNGAPYEDTSTRLGIMSTTMKVLADVEKSHSIAIGLKLRHQEAEAVSAAAHNDRLQVVLAATAPGAIVGSFPKEEMEKHLEEAFSSSIQDFELKTSPRDLE